MSEQLNRWINHWCNQNLPDDERVALTRKPYLPTATVVFSGIYKKMHNCDASTYANYPCAADIETVSAASTDAVSSTPSSDGKWYARTPKNLSGDTQFIPDRIVLNVRGDKDLITRLDDFCVKNGAEYKTPKTIDGWNQRHETVVIYFTKPITEDMKQEIRSIASPHVRRDNLSGERIARGVFISKEIRDEELDRLINKIRALDAGLAVSVSFYAMGKNFTGKPYLTPGQAKAVEAGLESFIAFQKSEGTDKYPQSGVGTPPGLS